VQLRFFRGENFETKVSKFNHILICEPISRVSNKTIRKKVDITFYKIMLFPTITYSSETTTWGKETKHCDEMPESKI
jgi:hypothetical protein